jgi:hypothetical protein
MSSRKTTLRFCSSGGPLQDNWAKTQACILIFGFGLAFFSTVNGEEATDIFDLFATAARGDVAGVQSRLEAHPAWVDVEQGGKTLLWEAAERGDTNIVALVLRFGANIEAKDRQASRTALWMAVCNGHKGAAELLLKHGADTMTTSHSGFTILHMCASKDAIKLLLAYKADVNARDITKRTPLHWAVEGAKVETVAELLESGADGRADKLDSASEPYNRAQGTPPVALSAGSGFAGLFYDISKVNTQGTRDAEHCVEGRIPHTPLHIADHLLGQTRSLSGLGHGNPTFTSLLPKNP